MSQALWFQITDAGLVAAASPGSILAYLPLIPRGGAVGVLGGIAIGAIVSAVVGVIVLRARPVKETDAGVEDTITVDNVPGV